MGGRLSTMPVNTACVDSTVHSADTTAISANEMLNAALCVLQIEIKIAEADIYVAIIDDKCVL